MDLNIVWEVEPESSEMKEILNRVLLRGLDLAWQMIGAKEGQGESEMDKLAVWEYDQVEIGMLVTDDKGICQRNSLYRGVDAPTDVLSFAVWEEEDLFGHEKPLLGDIIVSIETARKQAVEQGHSLSQEMIFLAVHALLHLLGYDHEEDEDYRIMRIWEKRMMAHIREDMAEGER